MVTSSFGVLEAQHLKNGDPFCPKTVAKTATEPLLFPRLPLTLFKEKKQRQTCSKQNWCF